MKHLPDIPGYTIEKKLGQGGMADVYLGVQMKLARKVAIKILDPLLLRDGQFAKRFIKEAQTAAGLIHPNIITIHDVGEVADGPHTYYYIVMEYLQESLKDRLHKQGPLDSSEALEIAKKVAGALDYAHENGFIHRDIKPDNIMFRFDGSVVLVDFGIARAVDSTTQLTRTGMSIGTPHYMSPEQCKGEKIDGRSDIYSLGVQLYEMFTGDVPFKAESTAGVIIKHIQDPIPNLPLVVRKYQPLLERMMAKDREMRVGSGSQLIGLIESYESGAEFESTIQVRPPHVVEPTGEDAVPTMVTPPAVAAAPSKTPTPRSTPIPTPIPSSTRIEDSRDKKWVLPAALAVLVVILAAALIYFLVIGPSEPGPNAQEKQSDTAAMADLSGTPSPIETNAGMEDTGEVETANSDTEPKETVRKDSPQKEIIREETAGKSQGSGLTKPTVTATQANKNQPSARPSKPVTKPPDNPQVEPEIKPEPKKEVPTPPKEAIPQEAGNIPSVTMLGVSPETLRLYKSRLKQFRVDLPRRNSQFRIRGHITVELSVNEFGKVSVGNLTHDLNIHPPMAKEKTLRFLRARLERFFLPAPKDKNGKKVRVSKWRVTYQVGKFRNKIILKKK